MSEKDDDDEKTVKTNAAPILKPPGLGLSGHAPAGMVGTDGKWFEGDFHVVGVRMPQSTPSHTGPSKPPPPDRSKIHFHETGDAEVDREYIAQGQVMVPKEDDPAQAIDAQADNRFLMKEGALERANDPALDKFHDNLRADEMAMQSEWEDRELDQFHGKSEATQSPAADETLDHLHDERSDDLRPQLWEDLNDKSKDDLPDR